MAELLLESIIDFLTNSLKFFKPVALSLAVSFMTIDLVLSFANSDVDFFKLIIPKTLTYGFFLTIILTYDTWILENIINGAIQLGNYGADGATTTSLRVTPLGFFMDIMFLLTPLFTAGGTGVIALDLAGIESIPMSLCMFGLGLLIMALLLALEIIMVVVEYYLIGICAILLMPFGMWSKTKSFAMRGISALFAQAFKVLMFTLLLNFLEIQWQKIVEAGLVLNIFSLGSSLFSVVILYMLVKRVSAISSALIGGTGVGSTGSSMALAGFASASFGTAGSMMKSEYSKMGGMSGLKEKFGFGGSGGTADAYKDATGTGSISDGK
ncbi:MAG: type IV secretion system protein [Bacilli bacterium]